MLTVKYMKGDLIYAYGKVYCVCCDLNCFDNFHGTNQEDR